MASLTTSTLRISQILSKTTPGGQYTNNLKHRRSCSSRTRPFCKTQRSASWRLKLNPNFSCRSKQLSTKLWTQTTGGPILPTLLPSRIIKTTTNARPTPCWACWVTSEALTMPLSSLLARSWAFTALKCTMPRSLLSYLSSESNPKRHKSLLTDSEASLAEMRDLGKQT